MQLIRLTDNAVIRTSHSDFLSIIADYYADTRSLKLEYLCPVSLNWQRFRLVDAPAADSFENLKQIVNDAMPMALGEYGAIADTDLVIHMLNAAVVQSFTGEQSNDFHL